MAMSTTDRIVIEADIHDISGGDPRGLAGRLRLVREESYGMHGIPRLATILGMPPRTWENYESGVVVPGFVILQFLCLTGVSPYWLLTGEGVAYPRKDAL
jgi:hypothetical protein